MTDPHALMRRLMVDRQIRSRGIRNPHVIEAMLQVPRHLFVDHDDLGEAYEDHPLPIGAGQTISQPYMVALMTELLDLELHHRVLEIGTGSGYQAAIIARMAEQIISIERIPELAANAREAISRLGYVNVEIVVGDGSLGWPAGAPFDRIVVTAAAPRVPPALEEQLAEGGRLVIPTGGLDMQELLLIEKRNGRLITRGHGGCRFVKLVGEQGWSEDQ
jgi:protein-L-isoaspartate(D-aspartate) O-methyltransferase